MPEHKPPSSLADLAARLKAARDRREGGKVEVADATGGRLSGIGFAFRVGVELVSALIVGAGLGWLLDQWLGTGPWLMVVLLFFGMGAGILNVYRAANRLSGIAADRGAGEGSGPDRDHS